MVERFLPIGMARNGDSRLRGDIVQHGLTVCIGIHVPTGADVENVGTSRRYLVARYQNHAAVIEPGDIGHLIVIGQCQKIVANRRVQLDGLLR